MLFIAQNGSQILFQPLGQRLVLFCQFIDSRPARRYHGRKQPFFVLDGCLPLDRFGNRHRLACHYDFRDGIRLDDGVFDTVPPFN